MTKKLAALMLLTCTACCSHGDAVDRVPTTDSLVENLASDSPSECERAYRDLQALPELNVPLLLQCLEDNREVTGKFTVADVVASWTVDVQGRSESYTGSMKYLIVRVADVVSLVLRRRFKLDLPFNSNASEDRRTEMIRSWRRWWNDHLERN